MIRSKFNSSYFIWKNWSLQEETFDQVNWHIMSATKRHEGESNCTNHLLSNHTFSKTPNMVKRPGLI